MSSLQTAVLLIMLFAASFTGIIFFDIFTDVSNEMMTNPTMAAVPAFNDTMTSAQGALGAFDFIFLIVFAGLTMVIILMSFVSDVPAAFLVIYIIITLVMTLVAIPLSYAYETFRVTPQINDTMVSFPITDYIMLNLPMMIFIIGLAASIVLFARIRSGGSNF